MSDSVDPLLAVLRAEAISPIEWALDERMADPAQFFDWLWVRAYEEYEVDGESSLFEDPYEVPFDRMPNGYSLRSALINVRDRYPLAARSYIQLTRPFWALQAATPTQHPKHFPKAGMTAASIQRATLSGESLLNAGIGPGQILEAFWAFLVDLCTHANPDTPPPMMEVDEYRERLRERLLGTGTRRFLLRTQLPIGYSYGLPATALCFELDQSTPVLHAYPVSDGEARELQDSLPPIAFNHFDGLTELGQRVYVQRAFGKIREGRAAA